MFFFNNWAKKVAQYLIIGLKNVFLGCKWGKTENEWILSVARQHFHTHFYFLHTQFFKSCLNPRLHVTVLNTYLAERTLFLIAKTNQKVDTVIPSQHTNTSCLLIAILYKYACTFFVSFTIGGSCGIQVNIQGQGQMLQRCLFGRHINI